MNNLFINNLKWSEANLSVTKFQNGDDIFFADNPYKWTKLNYGKQPAYSFPQFINSNFEPQNIDSFLIPTFGLIYNIYALIDKRELIPVGHRLPNFSEFKILNNYLLQDPNHNISETEENETILDTLFQSVIIDNNNIKIDNTTKNSFKFFAGGMLLPNGLIMQFGESAFFWANEFDNNSFGGFVKFNPWEPFKTELNYFNRECGFFIRTIQEYE